VYLGFPERFFLSTATKIVEKKKMKIRRIFTDFLYF